MTGSLNIRAFTVPFDDAFWREIVQWAADHTAYREQGELPPADPEYGWECRFCDYRHRCGQSDQPYSDEGSRGFLPGFGDYPREQVVEYLQAHEDAALTPTLARKYPNLSNEHKTHSWSCPSCETTFTWREIDHAPEAGDSPVCPKCAEKGELATLVVA